VNNFKFPFPTTLTTKSDFHHFFLIVFDGVTLKSNAPTALEKLSVFSFSGKAFTVIVFAPAETLLLSSVINCRPKHLYD
jgi:hypothetical protein